MGASAHVGRIGGLALALGIGAAVLGGTPVSWADDETGASADQSSTQTSARGSISPGAHDESAPAAARGASPAAATATNAEQRARDSATVALLDSRPDEAISLLDSTIQQNSPASEPRLTLKALTAQRAVTAAAQPSPVADTVPATVVAPAPVAQTAQVSPSTAEPIPAPTAAVASVPTGSVTALDDQLADSVHDGVPVDTPLDWTLLAYSRRTPLSAASTVAVPPAAATTTAAVATTAVATAPVATTAPTLPLILGPSGVPIPSPAYGDTVMQYYITPVTPPPVLPQQLLFTPEGLYPITGVKSLPLNTSVDQGIQILNDALTKLPADSPVTVFGYSQSAIIGSLLQGGYTVKVDGTPTTIAVPTDLQKSIGFIFVGNEMNPDGGFLSRFSGRDMPMLSLASLGIDFYGATPGGPVPPNGIEYPTTNYAREYDGFADFPRYPINLLSVLNAGLGIALVHVQYTPTETQAACAKKAFCLTLAEVDAARAYNQLPSTLPSQKYYFIPTENLPLLQPLRAIPFIGNPIADLIQPALKVLVDLGYADQPHGFTTAAPVNANELQPFGFLPPANVYGEAFEKFIAGIGQGITDFIGHFGPNGSVAQEVSAFSLPTLGPLAMGTTGNFISNIQEMINAVSNYISGTAARLYAALLPTADIINALVTTLPAYATNLFLYGMQEVFSGNVIQGLSDAIGLPIAAATGLSATAALVGALVWAEAIAPVFGQTARAI
jgi:hypothetical protein